MRLREVLQGGVTAIRTLGPPMREGEDVTMLWSCGHYDGPRTGVCLFRERKHWFEAVSDGHGDIVAHLIVAVSENDLRDEERRHDLFVSLVGLHTDYRYEGGRRVRVGEPWPATRWEEYCERTRHIRHDFDDREVVGWWCMPGLDIEKALAVGLDNGDCADDGSEGR